MGAPLLSQVPTMYVRLLEAYRRMLPEEQTSARASVSRLRLMVRMPRPFDGLHCRAFHKRLPLVLWKGLFRRCHHGSEHVKSCRRHWAEGKRGCDSIGEFVVSDTSLENNLNSKKTEFVHQLGVCSTWNTAEGCPGMNCWSNTA